MTRQQLEDEYARLLCLLSEPKPDTQAIEDAFRRVTVAALQWMDYAEGMVRNADTYRSLCVQMQALNDKAVAVNGELIRQLEQAREGNRILLRAIQHAGGEAAGPMQREECVRLCREVG